MLRRAILKQMVEGGRYARMDKSMSSGRVVYSKSIFFGLQIIELDSFLDRCLKELMLLGRIVLFGLQFSLFAWFECLNEVLNPVDEEKLDTGSPLLPSC